MIHDHPADLPGRASSLYDDRLLSWPRVREITGLSRTTAWRLQRAGDFPIPVRISPGRVGWRESQLETWQSSRTPRPKPEIVTLTGDPIDAGPAAGGALANAEKPAGEAVASAALGPSRNRRRPRPVAEGQAAFDF